MKPSLWTAAVWLAVLLPARARAAEPCDSVSRRTLVACAFARSPQLAAQRAEEAAAAGRRRSAGAILPSNPVVSAGLSTRASPTAQGLNWNVGLAQELEVSGQRGLRVDAADRALAAEGHRLDAMRTAVAADAWSVWFRVLAGRERVALAVKLEAATGAVAATARGMATAGLGAEVDADIAEAAALRAAEATLRAGAALDADRARLKRLTGTDAAVGELAPVRLDTTAAETPELRATRDHQAAAGARLALARRQRIPNPTVSLFAQSDGFDERVFGVGLAIPLPLPSGAIDEAAAVAARTTAEADGVTVEQAEERALAIREHETRLQIRALYSAERSAHARARLEGIALQVQAARLPVRDALLAQQALVDQLNGEVDAREALCLASVRRAKAAGQPLEGDDR